MHEKTKFNLIWTRLITYQIYDGEELKVDVDNHWLQNGSVNGRTLLL